VVKFQIFYANTHQHTPYGIKKYLKNDFELYSPKGACAIVKYTVPRHACTYHKEEITRTLSYIYGNWYYLWIEQSGWMGSVSYGLGADISLPPCLSAAIGIWTLAYKSDPWAEISGEIVWYDALAPRPEVLLSWYFTCACTHCLDLEFSPYSKIRLVLAIISYYSVPPCILAKIAHFEYPLEKLQFLS